MQGKKNGNPSEVPDPASARPEMKGISAFLPERPVDGNQPAPIYFSSTPLFRLESSPEKYAHFLRRKDLVNLDPIIRYFIRTSGHVAFLAGDVVRNLYLYGKKKYKTINVLAILTDGDVDKYSAVMNNIISSSDGQFSLGFKYRVKKNRGEGCFKDVACARYIVEPRLEGLEKLFYLFRPAAVELDLTSQDRFCSAFGGELK
ncbi:MAG: hypothetical protein M0Z71_15245 [Nitrospiraceae bacterium]|nr:hypothetical protein [Nitrospiraceae bacterium]